MAEGLFVDRAAGLFVSALPDASLDNVNDTFSKVKDAFVDALGADWSPVENKAKRIGYKHFLMKTAHSFWIVAPSNSNVPVLKSASIKPLKPWAPKT